MYEELVKRLRRCSQFKCRECEYEQIMGCRAKLDAEAADAIEELQGRAKVLEKIADKWCEAVSQWIPVSERLPENPHGLRREYFLVALESGCVESLGYDFDCNRWHISGSPVTHWMPLPSAPTEE